MNSSFTRLLIASIVFVLSFGMMIVWRPKSLMICLVVALAITGLGVSLSRKNMGSALFTLIGTIAGICAPLVLRPVDTAFEGGILILGGIVGGALGACAWRITSYLTRLRGTGN